MMENMSLWNQVSETDPSHTKHVNQRGGFTAIDAHYQVQTATEIWGPFGTGWGVHSEEFDMLTDTLLSYRAIMWYASDIAKCIPLHSSIVAVKDGKPDGDCVKKVATDALTKGLSKLGFNADVFLGRFDGNKYTGKGPKSENKSTSGKTQGTTGSREPSPKITDPDAPATGKQENAISNILKKHGLVEDQPDQFMAWATKTETLTKALASDIIGKPKEWIDGWREDTERGRPVKPLGVGDNEDIPF